MKEVMDIPDEILNKIPEELRKEVIGYIVTSNEKNSKKLKAYETAFQLYKEGLGKEYIAKKLGYANGTVSKWLYGLMKIRNRLEIPKELVKKLKFDVGLTYEELSRLLGIIPTAVYTTYIAPKREIKNRPLISERASKFIKESLNPLEFLKYIWKDVSKKELENFEKFCRFIKLKDALPPFELARQVGKSYQTIYKWSKVYNPSLVSWLELYVERGVPRENCLWLCIKTGSNGIPLSRPIEVPKKVTRWEDVKYVTNQLEDDKNILPEMSKYEAFGFILGMLVGDVSKSQSNKDLVALTLSEKYKTNELLGNFFCNCLQKIGIKAKRIKDGKYTYRWNSQSSPVLSWIYTVLLGLKLNETTTEHEIKSKWILDSPLEFTKRFLQGIYESDGCVTYTRTITCTSYPNAELIKQLLERIGIKSRLKGKDNRRINLIQGIEQLKKSQILFAPEIKTERYKLLEKIVNANKNKFGGRLPREIKDKIKTEVDKGLTGYEIIKRMLNERDFLISYSAIRSYKNAKSD